MEPWSVENADNTKATSNDSCQFSNFDFSKTWQHKNPVIFSHQGLNGYFFTCYKYSTLKSQISLFASESWWAKWLRNCFRINFGRLSYTKTALWIFCIIVSIKSILLVENVIAHKNLNFTHCFGTLVGGKIQKLQHVTCFPYQTFFSGGLSVRQLFSVEKYLVKFFVGFVHCIGTLIVRQIQSRGSLENRTEGKCRYFVRIFWFRWSIW